MGEKNLFERIRDKWLSLPKLGRYAIAVAVILVIASFLSRA